jgi:hypothetical protein
MPWLARTVSKLVDGYKPDSEPTLPVRAQEEMLWLSLGQRW